MLENMKNRRTIRKYTTQDIPDALLNELLEVAARASNTGNMQLYSVVITRDKANKEKLAPAHFNQPMITAAPVVLTFCADANRFVKWAELRDAVDYRCDAVCPKFLYGSRGKRIGNLLFGNDGL